MIVDGANANPGDPDLRPPRMTTRRWMIAVAVAAVLSTGLVGLIGLYRRRRHYLKWTVDRFAAVSDRTGEIQDLSEAAEAPGLSPPSRR